MLKRTLRNGVSVLGCDAHTRLYACSVLEKEKVEEERTQLHVGERVGVACRELEHPDSACVAEIQPGFSGDRRSLRCLKCMDE